MNPTRQLRLSDIVTFNNQPHTIISIITHTSTHQPEWRELVIAPHNTRGEPVTKHARLTTERSILANV